jgi:hypothetical protein
VHFEQLRQLQVRLAREADAAVATVLPVGAYGFDGALERMHTIVLERMQRLVATPPVAAASPHLGAAAAAAALLGS